MPSRWNFLWCSRRIRPRLRELLRGNGGGPLPWSNFYHSSWCLASRACGSRRSRASAVRHPLPVGTRHALAVHRNVWREGHMKFTTSGIKVGARRCSAAAVTAFTFSGAYAGGIDHQVVLDAGGMWNRNAQLALEYVVIATEVGGPTALDMQTRYERRPRPRHRPCGRWRPRIGIQPTAPGSKSECCPSRSCRQACDRGMRFTCRAKPRSNRH